MSGIKTREDFLKIKSEFNEHGIVLRARYIEHLEKTFKEPWLHGLGNGFRDPFSSRINADISKSFLCTENGFKIWSVRYLNEDTHGLEYDGYVYVHGDSGYGMKMFDDNYLIERKKIGGPRKFGELVKNNKKNILSVANNLRTIFFIETFFDKVLFSMFKNINGEPVRYY